jgi:predicted TIM-barrel fold metal-dependent hydrolase
MRTVDVDAHLHEPLDWLAQADPALAETLGPPLRFMEVVDGVFGFGDSALRLLPEHQQPKRLEERVPPGFITHLEITDDRQPADHLGLDEQAYFNADQRARWCDTRGIAVQFLNPTFLAGAFVQAGRAKRTDLTQSISRAWNTWASMQVEDHVDRLIPVTQLDFHDIEWTLGEMARMRERGSRAFVLPPMPVPTPGEGRTLGRSITHPDFEPIWDAAEDLGMAAFAHVGFSRERINPGWANNGSESVLTFNVLSSMNSLAPQLLLAALALDGLLERHPKLVVVAEEVGIDWLPHVVTVLDAAVGRVPEVLADDEYRPPILQTGDTYRLPLTPVEYLQRQVRVTPLVASHPIESVLRAVPPELLCFSSDYPHVEGASDAVAICERQLADFDDEVRRLFFEGSADLLDV